MGKIRKQRKKFHFSGQTDTFPQELMSEQERFTGFGSLPLPQNFDNIFAGIDISLDRLKNLRDDDTRSVVSTSKSLFKGRGMSKEERRKLRHQTFIERIQLIQSMKNKKSRGKAERKASSFILPAVPSSSNMSSHNNNNNIIETQRNHPLKKGGILNAKARHKHMLKDVVALRKIWDSPSFKANPTGLVSELVQERIASEVE